MFPNTVQKPSDSEQNSSFHLQSYADADGQRGRNIIALADLQSEKLNMFSLLFENLVHVTVTCILESEHHRTSLQNMFNLLLTKNKTIENFVSCCTQKDLFHFSLPLLLLLLLLLLSSSSSSSSSSHYILGHIFRGFITVDREKCN
jgi:hypothetical protein